MSVQYDTRVPSVSASDTNTYSAIWVGLDGSSNRTVEQIGTEQDWSSGGPVYYAWFEMYPQRGYQIMDFPVSPGDHISAEVQWISKTMFNLTITNASSTDLTLTIMTIVAVIFTPLVLLYQGWTYWIFRKRISSDRIPDVSKLATPPAAS